MKRVGFHGGSSIFEVGSASDMECFFYLIKQAGSSLDEIDIFTDRLYRRYIKQADIHKFESQLGTLESAFSKIKLNSGILENMGFFRESGSLDFCGKNMADVFQNYFKGIDYCISSCKAFYADWGVIKPVRVVCTEMPWYLEDKNRPLSDYDDLGDNENPFWLR